MAKPKLPVDLTEKQRAFCRHYILDWNGTQAAIKAGYSEQTAASIACENLTKPEIQAYITEIQKDIEKQAGISRLMVANEIKKLAFSSIAHMHNTWIELSVFDKLTDDQKACISEISTQKRVEMKYIGETEVPWEVDYVKIKLHDKQRALETLTRMLGYNAPDKIEHFGEAIKGLVIEPASNRGKR